MISLAIRICSKFKLLIAGNRTSDIVYFVRYSGDPGDKGPDYNMTSVTCSPAGLRLSRINCRVSKEDCMDTATTENLFYNLRSQAKIDGKCRERVSDPDPNSEPYDCFDGYCLFDLQRDPCEYQNVAALNQQVLNMTVDMLAQFKKELVKQYYPKVDPNSNPSHFDGYWETWMENNSANLTHRHTCILILTCLFYFVF